MIPVLSALSQWVTMKLTPQAASTDPNDPSANMMKSMNTTMPLMSAFFCLTFQIGLGIYWIASSVARGIIQLIMNKLFERIDVDDIIAKNVEKAEKRKEKEGYSKNQISTVANKNIRNMKSSGNSISAENEEAVKRAYESEAKPGSIADRARMVQRYNDRNKK